MAATLLATHPLLTRATIRANTAQSRYHPAATQLEYTPHSRHHLLCVVRYIDRKQVS
jgi:hypothetical protein